MNEVRLSNPWSTRKKNEEEQNEKEKSDEVCDDDSEECAHMGDVSFKDKTIACFPSTKKGHSHTTLQQQQQQQAEEKGDNNGVCDDEGDNECERDIVSSDVVDTEGGWKKRVHSALKKEHTTPQPEDSEEDEEVKCVSHDVHAGDDDRKSDEDGTTTHSKYADLEVCVCFCPSFSLSPPSSMLVV